MRLYGYVRRAGTTRGLRGIIVVATTLDRRYHDATITDSDGGYAIHFPRNSGQWTLIFKDPDGACESFETNALILDHEEQQQNVVNLGPA